jgi:hypothetical protein
MRISSRGLGLALSLLVAGATPAFGQAEQHTMKFTNAGTVTAWGYYVGPYQGQIVDEGNKTVTLNCVDFFHHVTMNQVWTVNATRLDAGTLAGTRFGALPNAMNLYRQAAWLTTQYTSNATTVKEIQASIWALFSGNAGAPTPSSNYWLALAQQNYQSVNLSEFYILSDVRGDVAASAQEFIVRSDMPVPGALLLVGAGLLGLVPTVRTRRRELSAEA